MATPPTYVDEEKKQPISNYIGDGVDSGEDVAIIDALIAEGKNLLDFKRQFVVGC